MCMGRAGRLRHGAYSQQQASPAASLIQRVDLCAGTRLRGGARQRLGKGRRARLHDARGGAGHAGYPKQRLAIKSALAGDGHAAPAARDALPPRGVALRGC